MLLIHLDILKPKVVSDTFQTLIPRGEYAKCEEAKMSRKPAPRSRLSTVTTQNQPTSALLNPDTPPSSILIPEIITFTLSTV